MKPDGDARGALPSVDRLAREVPEAEPSPSAWSAAGGKRELARPRRSRVVNAAGGVLPTHLGRAVLATSEAGARAAARCRDLELDLAGGERGQRVPIRAPEGGGSLPGFVLGAWTAPLRGGGGAEARAAALRSGRPPVLGLVRGGAPRLEMRSSLSGDAGDWSGALATVLDAGNSEPPC